MADYIVKDTELTSVASAIRTAGGTNSLLSFPNGFISAVGNISGGSSDFSTATVTVSMSAGTFTLPVVVSGTSDISDEMPFSGCISYPISTGNGGTYTIALYKGSAVGLFISDTNSCKIEVTGNIVYQAGAFLITGDGTITVTRLSMN